MKYTVYCKHAAIYLKGDTGHIVLIINVVTRVYVCVARVQITLGIV